MAGRLSAILCLGALLLQAQVAPRLVRRVQPVYPALAKSMRIQGTVRLSAVIDEDGTVAALKLISGHPLLVNAAIDAVKQWQYRAGTFNGRPVRAVIPVEVTFQISHDAAEQATRV